MEHLLEVQSKSKSKCIEARANAPLFRPFATLFDKSTQEYFCDVWLNKKGVLYSCERRSNALSSDEESTTCEENDQVKFVDLLKNYKIVLENSQVPTIKKAEEKALIQLQVEWQAVTGKAIGVKQLSKKINNMKTKIKQKADINKTGNKEIKLKSWEQAFLKLMDGNRNPTLAKIPSAVQVDVSPPIAATVSGDIYLESDSSALVSEPARITISKKIKKPHLPETTETQNLSTAELQMLVLLKDLEVLRLKKES